MKYKTGQNVDIGDGSVWRIIDIEDDVIEIETVGAVEYETLFVDESEIKTKVLYIEKDESLDGWFTTSGGDATNTK
jgi:hypothetical protein